MCLTLKKRLKNVEVVEKWSFKTDLDEKLGKAFNPNQT